MSTAKSFVTSSPSRRNARLLQSPWESKELRPWRTGQRRPAVLRLRCSADEPARPSLHETCKQAASPKHLAPFQASCFAVTQPFLWVTFRPLHTSPLLLRNRLFHRLPMLGHQRNQHQNNESEWNRHNTRLAKGHDRIIGAHPIDLGE